MRYLFDLLAVSSMVMNKNLRLLSIFFAVIWFAPVASFFVLGSLREEPPGFNKVFKKRRSSSLWCAGFRDESLLAIKSDFFYDRLNKEVMVFVFDLDVKNPSSDDGFSKDDLTRALDACWVFFSTAFTAFYGHKDLLKTLPHKYPQPQTVMFFAENAYFANALKSLFYQRFAQRFAETKITLCVNCWADSLYFDLEMS